MSAPDARQAATCSTPATRKYLDEFQSAQSMAAIGVANTVRQRLITATNCFENLGCMPEKASPMDISQLRSRVMAYFLLAEHPHDGLGVAVDDG